MEPAGNTFLKMDQVSFERLSKFITEEYGIKLPATKKSMLESRLNKKVKSLGVESYSQFLDHIFSEKGLKTDLVDVVDLITTNKTDFFREAAHFQFMTESFLPNYESNLNIWSAGCSTGEEPYTIIMALEEYKKQNTSFIYSILASDISQRVMQSAFTGIYTSDRLSGIPNQMKRDYFLKSKQNPSLVRVKPQFRRKIKYKRINLVEGQYGISKNYYDIIFCRNVLIYFDKPTQEKVIKNFSNYLKKGGLLFIGHSESLMGMDVPFKQLKPTIYEHI